MLPVGPKIRTALRAECVKKDMFLQVFEIASLSLSDLT